MKASALLASGFGDGDARRTAVARAAARGIAPAMLDELAAQQAVLPRCEARQRSLDQLARPGTAMVVTGQQVGLFLGPLYTIYKAATAVVVARALAEETGTPVVPMFWMATEDHDLEEVASCAIASGSEPPLRLRVDGEPCAPRQSVGDIRLGHGVSRALDELRGVLAAQPFGTEVAELLVEHYRPERSFGEAFAGVLAALFADHGLLVFQPRTAGAAVHAAPAFRTALARASEISQRLVARGEALAAAGLTAQVHLRPETSLVFSVDGAGARHSIAVADAEALAATVDAAPLAFSSSALLRPIVQDTLFPTCAYVGGPAEVSYLAQADALYELFGLPTPLVVPRARFRIIDARTHARLDALELAPADLEQPIDALLARIGARRPAAITPAALHDALVAGPRGVLDALPAQLGELGADLERAVARTRATIERAASRLSARWTRTLALADGHTVDRLRRARAVLYPDGVPQERVVGFASFAARLGTRELIARIIGALQPLDPSVRELGDGVA